MFTSCDQSQTVTGNIATSICVIILHNYIVAWNKIKLMITLFWELNYNIICALTYAKLKHSILGEELCLGH